MYVVRACSRLLLGLLLLGAPLWCSSADDLAVAKVAVTKPAAGVFLVARRGMPDPRFARSVVLLVKYSSRGALGLIVNHPTKISVSDAFPEVPQPQDSKEVMWFGGPVAMHSAALLMESPQAPAQAHTVLGSLHFSMSYELLQSLLTRSDSPRYRVYAGHAGWAPAQLDAELVRGDWHLRTANVEQALATETDALWETLIGASGTWVLNDGSRFRLPDADR